MENIIFGRNPVLEAITSGREIEKIIIKKGGREGSIIPILKKATSRGIFVQEVDRNRLDSMCDGENHQGIIAVVSDYKYSEVSDILKLAEEKGESPFVIICDKITDPHNLGAIIRTAECSGAHGIIIPKRNSATVNSVVAKTSAGAVLHIPVARVVNIASAIDDLKEKGMWFVGADMDGDEMYNVDFRGSIGLVVGSEGNGISRLVREKCDFIASIPMYGHVNSLNASVAAGVIMYEALRQRKA